MIAIPNGWNQQVQGVDYMTEKQINEKDIEMGLASLEYIKSQMENVRSQIMNLQGVVMDYDSALLILGELSKGSKGEMMVPIGGMVFLKARLENGVKCIADQGAGVYMEVEAKDGSDQILRRKEKIRDAISNLEKSLTELNERYRDLSEKTQRMYREQLRTGQGPDQTF